MQRGARDAATPQANDIEPSKRRDLALGKTERNDVAGDAARAFHGLMESGGIPLGDGL